MGVERIIGTDFGTSESVIRVKRYSNGQPVDDRLFVLCRIKKRWNCCGM